jgi:hypothetical protein
MRSPSIDDKVGRQKRRNALQLPHFSLKLEAKGPGASRIELKRSALVDTMSVRTDPFNFGVPRWEIAKMGLLV